MEVALDILQKQLEEFRKRRSQANLEMQMAKGTIHCREQEILVLDGQIEDTAEAIKFLMNQTVMK